MIKALPLILFILVVPLSGHSRVLEIPGAEQEESLFTRENCHETAEPYLRSAAAERGSGAAQTQELVDELAGWFCSSLCLGRLGCHQENLDYEIDAFYSENPVRPDSEEQESCVATYDIQANGNIVVSTNSKDISDTFKETQTYDDDGFISLTVALNMIKEENKDVSPEANYNVSREEVALMIEALEKQKSYWGQYVESDLYEEFKDLIDRYIDFSNEKLPKLKAYYERRATGGLDAQTIQRIHTFVQNNVDEHGYEGSAVQQTMYSTQANFNICSPEQLTPPEDPTMRRITKADMLENNNIFEKSLCSDHIRGQDHRNPIESQFQCQKYEVQLSSATQQRLGAFTPEASSTTPQPSSADER